MGRIGRRLGAPLILALVGACGGGDRPELVRWVPEDAPDLFDIGSFSETHTAFEWSFSTEPPPWLSSQPWLGAGTDWRLNARGLVPSPELATVVASFPAPPEVAALERVSVTVSGLRRGGVSLSWVRQGEAEKQDRWLDGAEVETQRRNARRLEFAVDSHPDWSGAISMLRLRLENPFRRAVALRSLDGSTASLSVDRVATAQGRPWKVEIGDEVRTALLALPGLPIDRKVTVPRAPSALGFAYGVAGGQTRDVLFRVSAIAASGQPQALFEERVPAGPDAGAPRWRSAEVDLTGYSGSEMELRFETLAEGGAPGRTGVPVWGHPELFTPAPSDHPNIVFISIDTLRQDHLSLYGYDRPTSPELDAWAQRSAVVFDDAVTPAPWTLPSHVSMLSGQDPLRHGVNHDRSRAPAQMDLLAEILRRAGYWTAATTAGGFMDPKFGLTQGHDVYSVDKGELAPAVDRAVTWLGSMRRPFYLFFHTYEVHAPYHAREPYFSEMSGGGAAPPSPVVPVGPGFSLATGERFDDPETAVAMYDSGIAYLDAELARLLTRLEAPDLVENTIVVFTSDHGEDLADRPIAGHGYLWENNLKVPLAIALPGRARAGERIARQVRSTDIVPTLLELAGLKNPSPMDGVSLLGLLENPDVEFPSTAVAYAPKKGEGLALRLNGETKLIVNNQAWAGGRRETALYDLSEDPLEARRLTDRQPFENRLLQEAQRHLASATGLWMSIANGGPGGLTGRIEARGIERDTVTSPDVACACLRLEAPGIAVLNVPPGESFLLRLETLEASELKIHLVSESPGGERREIDRTIDVSALEGRSSLTLSDSGWEVSSRRQTPPETGLQVWWRGPRSTGSGLETVEIDEALEEHLRALGYVN